LFPVYSRPDDMDDVIDQIEKATEDYDVVIIDLEGSRDKIATLALSQSNVAIIPLNGSAMEARQAAAAMKLIRSTSKIIGKNIAQWCLFTRVNSGIAWSDEIDVRKELETSGLPVLKERIEMRSPYTMIFKDALYISEMVEQNPSRGIVLNKFSKAQTNANIVCREIISKLMEVVK
jgi:chromosome partitioning protein